MKTLIYSRIVRDFSQFAQKKENKTRPFAYNVEIFHIFAAYFLGYAINYNGNSPLHHRLSAGLSGRFH